MARTDADSRPLRYRVQSGDTLSAIARDFAIPVEALVIANNRPITAPILAGEDLVVPDLVPTETVDGTALQPDFAAGPASESPDSNTDRLSHLQATVQQPVDRSALLARLRPDSEPAPPEVAVLAPPELPLVDDGAVASPAAEEPALDVHAEALLRSLARTDETTVVDVVPEIAPEPVRETAALPQAPARRPGAALTAAAAVNIAPSWQRPAPGRTVEPETPVLPADYHYLPQIEGDFSGYIWPTRGVISSGYGWRWGRMHRGVDIASAVGTPIVAAAPGVVEQAGWNTGGYGNLVDIRHPDGSITRYAHNSRLLVQRGQQVAQGQPIAEMGSTGYSTGPHLHFEIHQPSQGTVNPVALLPDQRYLRR